MELERPPPVTAVFLAGALGCSLLVRCNLTTPYQLFYAPRPVFHSGQVWRIVVRALTNFLYFGDIGIDFAFHLFFFARYSKMLELSTFHGRASDFVFMLLTIAGLLLLLAPLSPQPFLSAPLSFALVYLWSRLNPHVRLSLFGAITITAPNLPYALCLFSWALNSSWHAVIGDLMGIAVGHIYYFFTFMWTYELSSGRRNWLDTPYWLVRLLDGHQEVQRRKEAHRQQRQQREQERAILFGTTRP